MTGRAVTIRGPVTDALWARHLSGEAGLGIIPIRDDSSVHFGAIDIDAYQDFDLRALAAKIAGFDLPLIVCRSKSGGAHLYAFAAEPVPAIAMQGRLQGIAALLGYGGAEIFPKQTTLADGRDLGSWINMPYFMGERTDRYGITAAGDPMSPEEFLVFAERAASVATPEWFGKPLARKSDALPDGPPCLQHLMDLGFQPGTWNAGTFNLGVYCRKAYPDSWKEQLNKLNSINFPPENWSASDLVSITKSLDKKNYAYQCDKSPLKDHCNRAICRKRKYGVGGSNALPVLSSITKLLTTPPIWFLEVEGHRIELSTEELLNPLAFQVLCCNHNVIVPVIGRAQWVEHLRTAMESVCEIPVADDGADDESSPRAIMIEQLEEFCTGRVQGYSLETVVTGKPYTADGFTRFRLPSLMAHMSRKGFKFSRPDVIAMLKEQEGRSVQERIGKQVVRLWVVPEFHREPGSRTQDSDTSSLF